MEWSSNPANPRRMATTFLRFLMQTRSRTRRKKENEHVQHISNTYALPGSLSRLCADLSRRSSGRRTLCRGGISAVDRTERVAGGGDLYSVDPGGRHSPARR